MVHFYSAIWCTFSLLLTHDLIAYVNYTHVTAIDAGMLKMFVYEDLYNFSGLNETTIADWFNDVLFGAANKPESLNTGLIVIQGIKPHSQPKKLSYHEYKTSYSDRDAREKEKKKVALHFIHAPFHPDALEAAQFLSRINAEKYDFKLRCLADTILRTTDKLELAGRSAQIISSNIVSDAEDASEQKEFLNTTFSSTFSNSRRPQLARKTQAFDNYFSQSILKIV